MTVTFGDWITEIANWVFLAIALATLAGAFLVVTAKNVVRAVLALVVTFAGTAALFLMLGAEFVGWTVVLVYIGAVIILFLIGIMITRAPLTKKTELSQPMAMRAPAALLSILLFAIIAWAVSVSFGAEMIPLPDEATTNGVDRRDAVHQLGHPVRGRVVRAACRPDRRHRPGTAGRAGRG